jgi:hypothetical protein
MSEKLGIKELKELVELPLGLVSAWHDAKADGKVGYEDAALLFKLFPVVGPALDGVSGVPSELADLSSEEAGELVVHVMGKLAIDDPKARALAEKSLKVLAAAYDLYKAFRA